MSGHKLSEQEKKYTTAQARLQLDPGNKDLQKAFVAAAKEVTDVTKRRLDQEARERREEKEKEEKEIEYRRRKAKNSRDYYGRKKDEINEKMRKNYKDKNAGEGPSKGAWKG